MADYVSMFRTNYFTVKDEREFDDIVSKIVATDFHHDAIQSENGSCIKHVLYGYGVIEGFEIENINNEEEYDADYDYDAMLEALRQQVCEDDAIILTCIGHEKLRYLVGTATIITSNGIEFIDIESEAFAKARAMLDNQKWTTVNTY